MNPSELKRLVEQQAQAQQQQQQDSFESFSAAQLYCPKCKRAMPVREKQLLYLPSGQLFDYLCSGCGESLGTRQE